MKVYDLYEYNAQEKNPKEIDILKFITQQEASGIWIVKKVEGSKRGWDTHLTAVNYGIPRAKVDTLPVRRIQDGTASYLIDVDTKMLTKKEGRNSLYDADKIRIRFVFEGTIEDILQEFRNKEFMIN